MDNRKSSSEHQEAGLELDLTGLLGADRVFDAAGDALKQAELIDANCNKIGGETF
ncbi:MAG TPA: hypothetical protein VIJ94_04420 [Caulobacteraceae bacterium]